MLRFRHRESLDFRWISIPTYLAAIAGSLWALFQWPGKEGLWALTIATLMVAILLSRSRDYLERIALRLPELPIGALSNRIKNLPWVAVVFLLLYLTAMVPLGVVLLAGLIYWLRSQIVKAGASILSWLARGLAPLILRVLLSKAAMGADAGRFEDVSRLPPGVVMAEPLSEGLREKAKELGKAFVDTAGGTLLDAVTRGDAFAIKDLVERA
jgi:hypothetical protein